MTELGGHGNSTTWATALVSRVDGTRQSLIRMDLQLGRDDSPFGATVTIVVRRELLRASHGGWSPKGEAMDRFRRLGSGVVAVSAITVLVTVVGAGVKFTMLIPVVNWLF